MANDPIKTLTDTLTLLRVEIADVKKAQISEERFKHLEAALDDNGTKLEGIRQSAALGGREGALSFKHEVGQISTNIFRTVDIATRSLSEAQNKTTERLTVQKRHMNAFAALSGLTGVFLGAFIALLIYDYGLKRDFEDTLDLMGWTWTCRNQGGFVAEQENGTFCAFQIK